MIRRRLQLCRLTALSIVLSCISLSFAEDWPAYRHDRLRTGISADYQLLPGADVITDAIDSFLNEFSLDLSNDNSTINGLDVGSMTVTATDVYGFIGLGTPDFDRPLEEQDLVGFGIEDLDFGMGLFAPNIPGLDQLLKFYSAKIDVGRFSTIGLGDFLELSGENLQVRFNYGKPLGVLNPVIDFASSFPAETGDADGDGLFDEPVGLQLATGGEQQLYLDYDQSVVGVSVDNALIKILDFVYLNGSFAFEMGPRYQMDLNLDPGIPSEIADLLPSSLEFSSMTIGAANVNAFVGLGAGDYFDDPENSDAIGLAISDLNFGMAMFTPTLLPSNPVVTRQRRTQV